MEVGATWSIYQKIVAAYRNPFEREGRQQLEAVIQSMRRAVPGRLHELISLGRTFNRRAAHILANFNRPGTSNGPTEAIEGQARAPEWKRPGLPKPGQLHRRITAQHWRIQTTDTPSSVMNRFAS